MFCLVIIMRQPSSSTFLLRMLDEFIKRVPVQKELVMSNSRKPRDSPPWDTFASLEIIC